MRRLRIIYDMFFFSAVFIFQFPVHHYNVRYNNVSKMVNVFSSWIRSHTSSRPPAYLYLLDYHHSCNQDCGENMQCCIHLCCVQIHGHDILGLNVTSLTHVEYLAYFSSSSCISMFMTRKLHAWYGSFSSVWRMAFIYSASFRVSLYHLFFHIKSSLLPNRVLCPVSKMPAVNGMIKFPIACFLMHSCDFSLLV